MNKLISITIITAMLSGCDNKTIVHTDYNINICKNLTYNAVMQHAKNITYDSNIKDAVLFIAEKNCTQIIENTVFNPKQYVFVREKDKYLSAKADSKTVSEVMYKLPAIEALADTFAKKIALRSKEDARLFAEQANNIH